MSATETKRDEFRRYGNVILAGDEAQAYLDRMPAKEEGTPESPDTRKWLLEELRSGVPFAGDGEDGQELYDIDAANTTMDWAAREISTLAGWQAVAEQQADSIAKLERDVQHWQEAHVLAVKQREEANTYGDEEAERAEAAEAKLATIAKPVAWRRTETLIYEGVPPRIDFTVDAELAEIWRHHPNTQSLDALVLASPAAALSERDAPQAQAVAMEYLETHGGAVERAFQLLHDNTPEPIAPDEDDRGYYAHELKALAEARSALPFRDATPFAPIRPSTTEAKPDSSPDKFAYWNSLSEAEKAKIRGDWARDMFGDADD